MERIRIGTTVVRLTGVMMGGTLAMFTEGGAKCEHGSWMSRSGVRRAIQHMLLDRKKNSNNPLRFKLVHWQFQNGYFLYRAPQILEERTR